MAIGKIKMGSRHWYLTLISEKSKEKSKNNNPRTVAQFRCDCGKTILAGVYSVYYGIVRSCGCKSGSGYIASASQLESYTSVGILNYDDIVLSSKIETAEKELTEAHQSGANRRQSFEVMFNSTYRLLNRDDKEFDSTLIEKELTVGDIKFNVVFHVHYWYLIMTHWVVWWDKVYVHPPNFSASQLLKKVSIQT